MDKKRNFDKDVIETEAIISNFKADCKACCNDFDFANIEIDDDIICRCPNCGQRIKLIPFFD